MVNDKGLTSILDYLIEGVYLVSPDWRLLYVNNTMARYMKCSREQVLGRSILEVYPGFEETEVYAAYKRSLEQGVVIQKEIEFEFPDKSKGCFEIKVQPVEEGILVLAVDVTERNKASQKIAHSERLLSDSQKVAHIGSWEWHIRANKISWSEEMYRMFGFQPGEFEATYEALLKCTHPDDAPSLNELVQQAFHDHKDFEQYYRIVRQDGAIRVVHGKGYVVVENGMPVKMRGIAQDVTERRMVDDRIAQNEQLLAESQRVAQIGSWEWDVADDKMTASDELYRIFGVSKHEFNETYEGYLNYVHPEDQKLVNDTFQQAFKDHKDIDLFYRIIKPDGTIRIIHGKGNIVLKGGEPVKMRGVAQDVTERRMVEEKIAQNEQRLVESQMVAHIGSWEWDIAADKVEWSDEMYRIFGLKPGEYDATYEAFLKCIHPEDRQLVSDSITKAFDDHHDFEHYFRIVRPDGIERIVHGKGIVVLKNGEPVKMRGVSQDVTERRLVEEKIEQNEKLLSESQKIGHIGSWQWDLAANKLTWTDELYRIFGLRPQEVEPTYEMFMGCIHPDDKKFVTEQIQKDLEQQKHSDFSYRILRPDGEVRVVQSYGSVVVKDGKPIAVQGIAQDVTERKKAEEEVIKQKKFTEAVLNNMPDDVAVFDADQNYVFINPSAVSSPELRQWLIGKNDFDYCRFKGIDDTIAHKRKMNFDKAVQSKADVEWIDEQLNHQGQTVYVLRKFHPVFEGDQLAFVVGYGINITELKTTERKLEEAVQAAQSAFKELEQFAYMVSHDLQEPLRMVSSFLNLLKQKTAGQLDDSAKQYIHFAVDGAERMKTLIQDLLRFSRITTSFEDLKLVDLNKVLQYVIHVQQLDIEKNNVQITLNQLPVIKANDTLVTQLFMNLMGNAIKYNKNENPRVEVGSTEDADKWTFYIKDNGIGIAPEFLEKVFVIFKRLHSKQEYSGTGIGLAICKKIVETHKGKIWVESEQGSGSTFYFTIPKHIA